MQTQQPNLLKATLVSFSIALVVLVLFILPAEYNIDPTGVGAKLGLVILNPEANQQAVDAQSASANSSGVTEQKSVVVTIPAGRGVEYKLAMEQYQKVNYEWLTDNGELYVDLHGEPRGDTTGYFESYAIADAATMKGSFTAPFAGSHGWYWKNNSDTDMQVQLLFSGEFVIEGLKQ